MRWLARIFGRQMVWLQDHDGEVTRAWARKTPLGLVCRRYGRSCLLLDGGAVIGPSYVARWSE